MIPRALLLAERSGEEDQDLSLGIVSMTCLLEVGAKVLRLQLEGWTWSPGERSDCFLQLLKRLSSRRGKCFIEVPPGMKMDDEGMEVWLRSAAWNLNE